MTRTVRLLLAFVLVAAAGSPGLRAAPTSEVSGKVEDGQGNPIAGAVITVVNAVDEKATYEETSDKKGRYFIPGLLYVAPNSIWKIRAKADGYVLVKIRVDSRTQSQIVDKFEKELSPGGTGSFPVRPLGEARVDLVMVPPDQAPTARPSAESAGEAPARTAQPSDPFDKAREMLSKDDVNGSLPFFDQAIQAKPEEFDRRLEYGKALYRLQRYKEAEVQAAKAVQLAPDKPGPNRLLAHIYYDSDQIERADAAINKEREISPDDPGVLREAARLAEEMGHKDEAISAHERVVALQPTNTDSWVALGGLYAAKKLTDKSEAAFRKVTELDPANAYQTFYNIGALIMNQPSPTTAQTRKAIEAFRKAVELKPDYTAAHRQLVYALLNVGDIAEARAGIERYLEIDSTSADAKALQDLLKGLPKQKG